jgi:hypothetical protein
LFTECTQNGIVLEKVGQSSRVGQVVDCHEFNIRAAEGGPHDVSTNSAKAIDTNFYSHDVSC